MFIPLEDSPRNSSAGASVFETENRLFLIRNFQAAAPKIEETLPPAASTLQIVVQLVVHKTPFSPHLNEICVLHDLQMMRDRDDFCLKQFRDIANRQFAIPQCVYNLQPMRITQSLQAFCTILSIENFRGHCGSPIRNLYSKDHESVSGCYNGPAKESNQNHFSGCSCIIADSCRSMPAGQDFATYRDDILPPGVRSETDKSESSTAGTALTSFTSSSINTDSINTEGLNAKRTPGRTTLRQSACRHVHSHAESSRGIQLCAAAIS